jgi:hypothetical protein
MAFTVAMRILPGLVVLSVTTASAGAQKHAAHISRGTQTPLEEVAAFVAAARLGTERYRDRNVAIAAGFRRLGRDFPSMGEHWANPGKVIAGRFDVADPAMLTYASIDGKPVLLGVVYAIPLEPGQNAPMLPGGANPWHEHNGTVDEESFLPEHGGHHSKARTGTRLAILHVWTLLPNPAGDFAAENWSLPFARLHLKPPATAPEAAARALSLVSGSEEFYSNLLESELSSAPPEAWRVALAAAVARARAIVSRGAVSDALSRGQIDELEKTWIGFLGGLSQQSPALARRLEGAGEVVR